MTSAVMGTIASTAGSSKSISWLPSSTTPAAAGTNSSGKMPVKNSPVSRTWSSLSTPVFSAATISSRPYTLAGMGSGSTTARISPARQNAVMRANWKIYFTLLDPLFAKFLYIIPHRSIFDKLYIV